MRPGLLLRAGIATAMAVATVGAGPPDLVLSSSALLPGGRMPPAFVYDRDGCSGRNLSPPLVWRNPPKGTKSFALTLFDPDEKSTGSGWWHWAIYDLPATASSLAQGAGTRRSDTLPAGTRQGISDLGEKAYHGPCPAKGEPPHRYVLTLYALDVAKLEVPEGATGAMVTATAKSQALATATLTVLYRQ